MTQPSDKNIAEQFRKQAQQLIATSTVGDELLRQSATIENAVPIHSSDQSIHSWFVPVTVGDRLAGFFQFLPDGTMMRYSSFQRRAGDFSTCPPTADWLDTERIRSRAAALRQPEEKVETPFLSFDRSPDRIAWAVPLMNERGNTRLVYVAGQSVYLPPSEGTIG